MLYTKTNSIIIIKIKTKILIIKTKILRKKIIKIITNLKKWMMGFKNMSKRKIRKLFKTKSHN